MVGFRYTRNVLRIVRRWVSSIIERSILGIVNRWGLHMITRCVLDFIEMEEWCESLPDRDRFKCLCYGSLWEGVLN